MKINYNRDVIKNQFFWKLKKKIVHDTTGVCKSYAFGYYKFYKLSKIFKKKMKLR